MAAALRFAAGRLIGGASPAAGRVGASYKSVLSPRQQAVYKSVLSPLAEEERRLLLPRLVYGGRPVSFPFRTLSTLSSCGGAAHPPNGTQQPSAKPASEVDPEREWAYIQITKIETKKHELFYLLAEMDKRYPDRRYTKNNMELIHHLFGHIAPDPSDPLWRHCRVKEIISNCVVYGVPTFYAIWMYLDWDGWRDMFAYFLGS